jgi:uncharacterized membrane protein YqjE
MRIPTPTMQPPPPTSTGFLGALRSLGDGVLGTVKDRLELFSVELQEEKYRLVQTMLWISAAVFAAIMATTFVSLTLVFLFWQSAQLAVLGGLAAFYTTALVVIVIAFRRFLARQPKPFAATLEELGADRSCIRNAS